MESLDQFSLKDRVAIITGASSGLGVQFAEAMAGAGARLVLAARREDRLREVAGTLPGAVAIPCDVTDDADRQRLVQSAIDEFGRIDILVNNAGATNIEPAESESFAAFRNVIEVNLIAVWRLSQLVANHMLQQGRGNIINIASILGLVGGGQIPQSSYVASKSGMVGLTRELGAQWARRGIRVNAIAPGFFASELTDDMTTNEDNGLRWIRNKTPMGRPGDAHELDGALIFLASDASAYITGHTIPVDGGWTAV